MAITRTASARYEGLGKTGKGEISSQSGVLNNTRYGFNTRFEGEPGTNPEELIAAAHAACYTMALSFALAGEGLTGGTIDTTAKVTLEQDGDGFTVTKSALTMAATIPGISAERFDAIAREAEKTCPISKVLNCEITLEATLAPAGDPA